jgi:hypothetical protein
MAEDFTGIKPINEPIKPDQQRLEDVKPVVELSDISAMDDMAKKLMEDKAKQEAEEAEAAKKAQEEADAAAAAEAAKTDEEKEAERKAAEEAAAAEAAKTDEEKEAERKAAEEAAAAEAAKTDEEKEAERKAAEEAAAAEAAKAAEEDPYKDVELPANARGKSAEAFATVKARAAADLAKRDEEISKLKSQIEQHEAAMSDPVPAETKKELEELRLFRAKLDLQADPEFTKKYTGKIDQTNEFIYAQLKSTGVVGDEHIAKIRELGGLDKTNYEQILEKIDNPQVVRLVQGKLDEIAVLRFEKGRALEVAQGDVEKYVKDRQEQYTKSLTAHHETTNAELEKIYTKNMAWLNDPELPATASADEKTIHADAVKFNGEVRGHMAVALKDDSPEMRAVLIAGMGQLLYLKRQYEMTSKALEISEKSRKELEAKLDKIKRASVSKLRESNAPPSPGLPKPKMDVNTSAAEALDAHRKEQLSRG